MEQVKKSGKVVSLKSASKKKVMQPSLYPTVSQVFKKKYGYLPSTAWIADMKHDLGLKTRVAHNRTKGGRTQLCPESKKDFIRNAIRVFLKKSEPKAKLAKAS